MGEREEKAFAVSAKSSFDCIAMKSKMVSYTWETLPPLTEEDRARLKAITERPDSEIDFSDIPELTEEQMKYAVRGRLFRSPQSENAISLDPDVLEWLKKDGAGADARANAILRREMLAELERKLATH